MTKNDPKINGSRIKQIKQMVKMDKMDKKDEESCPNDGTKMHNEKAGIWCRGKGKKKNTGIQCRNNRRRGTDFALSREAENGLKETGGRENR